jgi:hypothetical protein
LDPKIKIIENQANSQDYPLTLTLVRKKKKNSQQTTYCPIDFSPLFDWNTKQIFVTVVADYQTDKYVREQRVADRGTDVE